MNYNLIKESNNYKIILSHQNLYNNILDNKSKFKFVTIRDPIDRFISHYYFFYYKNGDSLHLKDMSDEAIKNLPLTVILHRLSNGTGDLNILEKNIKDVDIICDLKDLKNNLEKINKKLNDFFNVNHKLNLEYKNNNKFNYKKYVTPDLLKRLEIILEKDIKTYNILKKYCI